MTQTQAVAVTTKDKVAVIDTALEERRDALLAILPDTMDYERFRKVVTLAVSKSPDLMACDPASIVRAVIEAAELGLEPTGALGRAYLVAYNENVAPKGQPAKYVKRAQLQIGYLGLAELARRSGVIRSVEARLVYEGDTFHVRMGTDKSVQHEPAFLTSSPDDIRLVYALAWFHDGSWDYEVMPKVEVDGIRARSKAGNRGPWVSDYGEMAKKTVLRRLLKRLPLTIETLDAIARDDEREYAVPVVTTPEPVRRESFMSKLRRPPEPEAAVEPEEAQSSAPVASDPPEQSPPPAPADQPQEVEGEVVEAPPKRPRQPLCGAESPYGDGLTCALVQKHLGLHRADEGRSSWPA